MMVANKPLNKMKCIYFRVKPAWNIQMHPLVILSKKKKPNYTIDIHRGASELW